MVETGVSTKVTCVEGAPFFYINILFVLTGKLLFTKQLSYSPLLKYQ